MTTNTELIARLRSFETDHKPDGWPAIQMRDVSALLDAIEALEATNSANMATCKGIIQGLQAERDALQAQLAAARAQEPVGFVESAVRGAGGFHACFSSGVFIPAGTQLFAAPIPQQPDTAPSSLPLLSEAFRTTESNGVSSNYRMVFKFKCLASLQSADDEWRKFKGAV